METRAIVTTEQHGWSEEWKMPGGDEKQADTQYYINAEVTGHSLILETTLFYFQVYNLAIIPRVFI